MPTLIKTFTSAQASGVKSYISTAAASSFSTSTWANVGTGASGATTTTAAELPELTVGSAIKVTNAGSGTGYMESVEFRIDAGDLGKLFAINYAYDTSSSPAYVAGDYQIQIWDSTTSNGTYAQNTTVSTPAVPANTSSGTFTITFSQQNARPFTKLRIVRIAGVASSWASFSTIQVTPGTITQGAAVGNWESTTSYTVGATTTPPTAGTGTTYYRQTTRDGDWAIIRYEVVQSSLTGAASGSGDYLFPMPSGLTIDTTRVGVTSASTRARAVGTGSAQFGGTAYQLTCYSLNSGAYINKIFCEVGNDTVAFGSAWGSTTGGFAANANTLASFTVRVPIAEWSGSGTVNLGAGAQVEYAATSGTWDAASTTTVYGPGGQAIGGTLTAARAKTVTWQYPIQADDMIVTEYSADQLTWVPLNMSRIGSTPIIPGIDSVGTEVSAAYTKNTSSTQTEVLFGRYANIANDDSPVANWPASGYWRVRKAKASSPVGFSNADSNSAGLVKPRKGQYAVTVTSNPVFTSYTAKAIYYQDQDGNHRLKFNVAGVVASASRSGAQFTFTGVVFKNTSNFFQPVTGLAGTPAVANAYTTPNTGIIEILHASATTTNYGVSGDVELESKPSWA